MNLRVRATGLAKSHLSTRKPHPALMGVNLDWAGGSLHLLTGSNGAGKTSLLKILAGLDTYDAGHIEIVDPCRTQDSGIIENATAHILRTLTAWLPDRPGFSSSLTARQSFDEVLILDGVPAHQRRERIEQACQDFSLEEFIDRPAAASSRGQQAQLAFARLSTLDRHYWFLDEPFAALDQDAIGRVCHWIQARVQQGDLVVLCTHHADGGPALSRSWPFSVKHWAIAQGRIEPVIHSIELDLSLAEKHS